MGYGYGARLADVFRLGHLIDGRGWAGQQRAWSMRGLGLAIRGCSLGVVFSGPGAVVGDVGAMARFAVLVRWFDHRNVGRN
eukprot:scaffold203187_cov82-Attheya_sp.AAC.5